MPWLLGQIRRAGDRSSRVAALLALFLSQMVLACPAVGRDYYTSLMSSLLLYSADQVTGDPSECLDVVRPVFTYPCCNLLWLFTYMSRPSSLSLSDLSCLCGLLYLCAYAQLCVCAYVLAYVL